MFLVPYTYMANVRSADPILPLKIQNSNAFNVFLPLLGAFGLCSHGPRAACSPARHGPGDPPAVVPITDTHHKRRLPAQYDLGSEPEHVRSSRRRVHVGRGPCLVVGGIPLTHTHNALPRWCLCKRHHPRCVWEGAGRPWTWLCGRRAAAEARRPTEAHTREEGRTSRMTKISGVGCQQTPFRQPGAIHGS